MKKHNIMKTNIRSLSFAILLDSRLYAATGSTLPVKTFKQIFSATAISTPKRYFTDVSHYIMTRNH